MESEAYSWVFGSSDEEAHNRRVTDDPEYANTWSYVTSKLDEKGHEPKEVLNEILKKKVKKKKSKWYKRAYRKMKEPSTYVYVAIAVVGIAMVALFFKWIMDLFGINIPFLSSSRGTAELHAAEVQYMAA